MMGRRADIDLTGKTFNLLTVIGEAQERKNNKPAWLCVCTCGKECLFTTNELQSCRAKSCGHLRGLSSALDLTDMVF